MDSKKLDELESKPLEEQLKQHREEFYVNMTPTAIPTKDEMTNLLYAIQEMIELIEQPWMQELKRKEDPKYKNEVYMRYNQRVPMKIIGLMFDDDRYDNLDKLLDMFAILSDVKAGNKEMNVEFDKFRDKLNDEYLYKPHGGKEEFEKKFKK